MEGVKKITKYGGLRINGSPHRATVAEDGYVQKLLMARQAKSVVRAGPSFAPEMRGSCKI